MTYKEKILAEIEKRIEECKDMKIESDYYDGLVFAFEEVRDFINSLSEEPVSENLDRAAKEYAKAKHQNKALIDIVSMDFMAGAQWQYDSIRQVLLSEVLPCFMHGGEADEVVAKMDEVLSKQ